MRSNSPEMLAELTKFRDNGWKQHEVAKALGWSKSKLASICSRYNIDGWPRGAAARDQKGIKNPNFVDGNSRATRGRETKNALLKAGRNLFICDRCGYSNGIELPRHHRDRDNSNHASDNLEILCVSCHNKEHMKERVRDNLGRLT